VYGIVSLPVLSISLPRRSGDRANPLVKGSVFYSFIDLDMRLTRVYTPSFARMCTAEANLSWGNRVRDEYSEYGPG